MKLKNPIAFTPLPVTIITSVVYAALIISLLVVHHVVPDPPKSIPGVDLDEAWLDLQTLSNGFHPYNSHRNDVVRNWLLKRIESIVHGDGHAGFEVQDPITSSDSRTRTTNSSGTDPVVIFSDMTSNVSSVASSPSSSLGYSTYFEGTNIMVYIRGSEDDPANWWLSKQEPKHDGGVLINAHYDSVSTGFGATDDGVGAAIILQLLKYFLSPERQPKKGIIALFNNGEEDGLNGARAFSQHPLSHFPKTFLNLEGGGAGGRAVLFRSTDTEVTRAYQRSAHPFGSVIGADAFKRGLVKSDTDYSLFSSLFGMRGLDVAFMEPRARYHTDQDDTKHTSKASLFHMLSTALPTMQGLTAGTQSTAKREGKDSPNEGSDGVWFDLFGSALAVFQLHTLFALSVTLLVVAPLTLIAIGTFLHRMDRFYIFSGPKSLSGSNNGETISIQGWRGLSRWPIAFVLASAAVIGLAFLVVMINPYIIYSSRYAVWIMMISAWAVIVWLYVGVADTFRPTALERLYTLLWMFLTGWILLIAITIFEKHPKIAGGYLVVFYFACIFLATTVCFLELFSLPRKSHYAAEIYSTVGQPTGELPESAGRPNVQNLAPPDEEGQGPIPDDEDDEADERTSLIRGAGPGKTTFKHYTSPNERAEAAEHEASEHQPRRKVYGLEQPWSHPLPSSLWVLEFLLLAPFPLIIFGQVSLLLTSAMSQTMADGGSPLTVHLAIAVLSILLLAPLGPFIHRYTYHIPTFLFLVFIGTLIYNMVAFPFSANNRLKVFFQQKVDLDTSLNNVSLTGVSKGSFLLDVVHSLPSSAGKDITCIPSPLRKGLTECSWSGLPPHVVPDTHSHIPPETGYRDWLTYNITRSINITNSAKFHISGQDTRACKILFHQPIRDFHIKGSGPADKRFPKVSEEGSKELRLWSREWERDWEGAFQWDTEHRERKERGKTTGGESSGMDGRVVCLWSDANTPGVIPALDEVWRFAPEWVAVSKAGDGLVEGSKAFAV